MVMSGQVLAVSSGIFASLASIFSKLALSNDVHALDRHVFGVFCTTEDNVECFPVRTSSPFNTNVTYICSLSTVVHAVACCHEWPKDQNTLSCAMYAMSTCAGFSPAARSNAVSNAEQQWGDADNICQGNAEVQLHC